MNPANIVGEAVVTVIEMTALAALVSFTVIMACAGLMDLTSMKIRNWLVLLLVAVYAVLAPLAGLGLQEIGLGAIVAGTVFLCTFTLFGFGWIGGGDAKLATATALWLGADYVLGYLAYMAIFGGLLVLALLAFRNVKLPTGWLVPAWIARLHSPQTGVPYGVAMALAALVVFPQTHWVVALF